MSQPPHTSDEMILGEVSMLDPALSEADSLDLADVDMDVETRIGLGQVMSQLQGDSAEDEAGEGKGKRGNNNPLGKNGHRPSPRANDQLKSILERYFAEGMTGFKDINERLGREHGEDMKFGSASSFYRTTAAFGVGGTRKAKLTREELAIEVLRLAQEDEQGSMGYRNMTRKLREKGILVPRDWVYQALKDTDATGIAKRRPKAALLREIAQQSSSSLPEPEPEPEIDPATLSSLSDPKLYPTTNTSSSSTGEIVSPFGPVRRVLTSHDPSDIDGSNVKIHDDQVSLAPVLDGNAFITTLFSHYDLPTTSTHSLEPEAIQAAVDAAPNVVMPGGVNGKVTDVQPNYYIAMHRTNSVDYNIMVKGQATLITPKPGAEGGLERTVVKAGEVVIQRGTIHAWESGPEGARWITVVVPALPVEKDGNVFGEVDFK